MIMKATNCMHACMRDCAIVTTSVVHCTLTHPAAPRRSVSSSRLAPSFILSACRSKPTSTADPQARTFAAVADPTPGQNRGPLRPRLPLPPPLPPPPLRLPMKPPRPPPPPPRPPPARPVSLLRRHLLKIPDDGFLPPPLLLWLLVAVARRAAAARLKLPLPFWLTPPVLGLFGASTRAPELTSTSSAAIVK